MRFLVITLAPSLHKESAIYSYAPYVKEMNLWFDKVEKPVILSPTKYKKKLLTSSFDNSNIEVVSIPSIYGGSILGLLKSALVLPSIFFKMMVQMKRADHIHLRCPSNIGLIGCFVQVLFPKKIKTAKYAGNWDPKAIQPLSYRLQKWILANTFLTKNMNVLVYGDWPNQSKNIKSFFTASYTKKEIIGTPPKVFKAPYKFLFVGSLVSGKRPLYAIKLIESLVKSGTQCTLELYGDGVERAILETYVLDHQLNNVIKFRGNKAAAEVQQAYKDSSFLILPSKSEGWPKVVAEAMFWGVIPIVTHISCVPWMLDFGARGILMSTIKQQDLAVLLEQLEYPKKLQEMSNKAKQWSQEYTLDTFEAEILKLLK
ncbi:glycosyltransferase family 4 protein [Patiriisocius marinus]|uniref:Glycosyl transferase n=1 Tax=Patiriisocius marinus TaxID=1397112 RepID=A0A5J4J125_9FLAO|nr:glycosyltransferase [Patiriisocius marinus]GER59688.1 glycosyl transferase [Patiriisocius marinus]